MNLYTQAIAQWHAQVGRSYTDRWRHITARVTLTEAGDDGRTYNALLTNTQTGVSIPYVQHTGALFSDSHRGDGHICCLCICEHIAAICDHVFIDGYPSHGLQPFSEDTAPAWHRPIDDTWAEGVDYDPQARESWTAYTDWVQTACNGAALLDDATRADAIDDAG